MVSAIIPVLNEETRIKAVIAALEASPQIKEILVVDDGSSDRTAEVAAKTSARVIRMDSNMGKAAAMTRGVAEAKYDIILFMDGDIAGLTPAHIASLVDPVINERVDMFIGITARDTFWLNRILHFFPLLSGLRALRRELWDMVPLEYKNRFQIEIALNYYSNRTSRGAGVMLLRNVRNTVKEKKYGLLNGSLRRLWMIGDILLISTRLYIVKTAADMLFPKAAPEEIIKN